MPTIEANPLRGWPRVRQTKPGTYVVKGRCIHALRWWLLRKFAILITGLAALYLFLAAVIPYAAHATSLPHNDLIDDTMQPFIQFRFYLRELLTHSYPSIGRAVSYTGRNPIDWHLLALSIVLYCLRIWISVAVALALSLPLWPLITQRFEVAFTSSHVYVHRLMHLMKLPRSMVERVSFHTVDVSHQRGISGLIRRRLHGADRHNRFDAVAVLQGTRTHRLVTPRSAIVADRIVEALNIAMERSSRL